MTTLRAADDSHGELVVAVRRPTSGDGEPSGAAVDLHSRSS